MKLNNVVIHNFRGIIDQTITFENYALLVGANNSGKSTVIDAIRSFYEKDGFKYKEENDFPFSKNTDNESWVELHLNLTEDENNSIADEYKITAKALRVRKYFKTTSKLRDGKTAVGSILGYNKEGVISDNPFYGAKNVQSGKFGDLIYIPTVSKVDEFTKLSGPSALRDLITNIMANVVEKSEVYQNLTQSVQLFAEGVKTIENEDKRSLSNFESDLNAMLSSWQTKFKLKFSSPSTSEIIKSMLGWEIKDDYHDRSQNIEYFGSGFQRHFIYSLIQLGAKYIPSKSPKKAKDFAPSFNLILFEEPEAFLHPSQQEELANNLITLGETQDWQVISSTHSSHFVSQNAGNIPSIIHMSRTEGIVHSFQIKKEDWKKIIDSNQIMGLTDGKYPNLKKKMQVDDMKPEMEAIKYFLWLNPDRASMFFSSAVLLVEGPSETALIHKLTNEGKLKLPVGTHVLDCLGKYNIHRFMNLLGIMGILHSVIYDDDHNYNEHEELARLIVEAKNPYTVEIKAIPDKLETLLSIPPSVRPDRKPQHVLFCHASGVIKPEKIGEFCELVNSCFPPKKAEKK